MSVRNWPLIEVIDVSISELNHEAAGLHGDIQSGVEAVMLGGFFHLKPPSFPSAWPTAPVQP